VVELSEEERGRLAAIAQSSKRIAHKKRVRAQVLLKVDEGKQGSAWTDERTAEAFDIHINTVHSIRKQLVRQGLDSTLERKERAEPARKPIFDQTKEKELLAIATSDPPEGRARWTLHLLADEVVRLDIVESVSHETVRKVLKKGICNPTVSKRG
jgi:transposase